jgi:hypothetical protein
VELLGPHYRVESFAGQLTNVKDPESMCRISLLGQYLIQACSKKIADLQGKKLVNGPTATSLPFYSFRSNSQGSQDCDIADVSRNPERATSDRCPFDIRTYPTYRVGGSPSIECLIRRERL